MQPRSNILLTQAPRWSLARVPILVFTMKAKATVPAQAGVQGPLLGISRVRALQRFSTGVSQHLLQTYF